MILDYTKEQLEQLGSFYTASEIVQQPKVWKKVIDGLIEKKSDIEGFLKNLHDNYNFVRVILCGAGTSAYIGEILLPCLQFDQQYENFRFESIPTTDLVSAPSHYFKKDVPTLLVSFARSGNSPESVAASRLGNQIVKDFYQIIITCNEEGLLANDARQDNNSLLLLMPKETNDQGFAMTSSFTSMLFAGSFVFQTGKVSKYREFVNEIVHSAEQFFSLTLVNKINEISKQKFSRIVYLGSGMLCGLARESALKMLELTAGKIVAVYESSLGFRHGPKSIINDETLVVMYISNNPYTRKYDIDMMKEIYNGEINVQVVALAQNPNEEIRRNCHYLIEVPMNHWSDFELAFLYILFAQTLALKKSINLGIEPDNPSPGGIVNRVVKGVTIYPLK